MMSLHCHIPIYYDLISYMKSGYDIMILYSMISCVICMHVIETKNYITESAYFDLNSTTDTSSVDD